MSPVIIDLSGLQAQFGLAASVIDTLTETCVNEVTAIIFQNWQSIARRELKGTAEEYTNHLIKVDKGRFAKQIVLTGVLPNMLEQGASAFDMKEGFKKSDKVKYTIPVYNAKGAQVYAGGDWYLTIPFRIGVPGTLGQAGFSGEMPHEIYDAMVHRASRSPLTAGEIPSPYDIPKSREAIMQNGIIVYGKYQHKNSIYEGLTKRTAVYAKTTQNTYGTFRRAGTNSDPLAWIHKGLSPRGFAQKAIDATDVEGIVENEVTNYLEEIL